jgi:zinc protease
VFRLLPFSVTEVSEFRLDNGLTLLVREDHAVPIVTCMTWYRVGSRHEPRGATGVSHFVEHMLFKGTSGIGKGRIDFITAVNGGDNNAFTAHDYTSYYFTFASDRWWPSLEIEADRMLNASFDPDEFELERHVILEEIRMCLDNPWEAMRQAVDKAAFPNHPYGNPIIGRQEDLAGLSRQAVTDFYRRYYRPDNCLLVVVGDVDRNPLLDRVGLLFSDLPRKRGDGDSAASEAVAEVAQGAFVNLTRPCGVARLLIGLPAPAFRDPDYYAVQVIDRLLGQGKLSRLHRRLLEEDRIVSMVDSEIEETADPYRFFLRFELRPRVSVDAVLDAVMDELDRLARRPVDREELAKAQNQCITQFLWDLESTLDQAFQLGLFTVLDRWQRVGEYVSAIERVGPDDVLRAAARYCKRSGAVICAMTPEPGHV